MKKSFWIFQNGGFFSIADFFFEKLVFSAKSGEFVLRFEKFLFYLKALQNVMQVMVKRFSVAQMKCYEVIWSHWNESNCIMSMHNVNMCHACMGQNINNTPCWWGSNEEWGVRVWEYPHKTLMALNEWAICLKKRPKKARNFLIPLCSKFHFISGALDASPMYQVFL